jgi:hypothetical protein
MRAKEMLAAGLFLSAAPSAWSVEPVTAQNWRRHPAVLEVKAIYHEVRQAVAAGRLRQLRWVFGGCQLHEERVLNRERGYAIRSYHWIGSSEDSWSQFAYYYDRGGRLRFVLMKAGAANGTRLERRIYLSKGGKQLWEAETRTGPGWTFPETGLVHDPEQDFRRDSPCSGPKAN